MSWVRYVLIEILFNENMKEFEIVYKKNLTKSVKEFFLKTCRFQHYFFLNFQI